MNQLERNKEAVIGFYDLMFNQCKPAEAIEKYVGDVYIQHNPEVGESYFDRLGRNLAAVV